MQKAGVRSIAELRKITIQRVQYMQISTMVRSFIVSYVTGKKRSPVPKQNSDRVLFKNELSKTHSLVAVTGTKKYFLPTK